MRIILMEIDNSKNDSKINLMKLYKNEMKKKTEKQKLVLEKKLEGRHRRK